MATHGAVREELVNRIYRLATQLDGITEITSLVARETRSRSCGLIVQNKIDHSVRGGWYWGIDHVWGLAYMTRYFACDPTVVEHFRLPAQRAYATPLNRENAEFCRSEFFTGFCLPQRIGYFAGVYADQSETIALRLTVQGDFDRGQYEPEALMFLEAVLPHLRRAVGINREVTQLIGHSRAFCAMLQQSRSAIVLMNVAGEVVHANEAVHAMSGRGFTLNGTRLRLIDAAAQRQMQAAVVACSAALSMSSEPVMQAGCHVPIPRARGLALSAYVSPFRLVGASPHAPLPADLVMVQIADPEQEVGLDAAHLRDVMGLTRAESRVASLLCRGDSAQEIALALSLSPHTVRDHIKHIYARVGVSKLSEFVARAYAALRTPFAA